MALFKIGKTIIKSLVGKPATLMYPVKPAKRYDISRGHVVNDIKRCIFCGACQRTCPTAAICVTREKKQWEIDRLRCVVCGACVEVCPVKCLSMDTGYSASTTKRERDTFRMPEG